MKGASRSKYLKDDLKAFPYTNGGLFEKPIEIPQFTEEPSFRLTDLTLTSLTQRMNRSSWQNCSSYINH